MSSRSRKILVPNAKQELNKMKFEISDGINHQGEAMCDICGSVGGTITRKLVELGEEQLKKQNHQ
ncbi:MAG: small, acid-soluble spore protein, alpha/beta type [Longibaculum sp.]